MPGEYPSTLNLSGDNPTEENVARYAASEIAAALQVPRKTLADQLPPPLRTTRRRGNSATAVYTLSELPRAIRQRLEAETARGHYSSIHHLLQSSRPPDPIVADSAKLETQRRRELLASLIAGRGVGSILQLAQRASAISNDPIRTIRRWISTAIDRDEGREDWARDFLYADRSALLPANTRKVETKSQLWETRGMELPILSEAINSGRKRGDIIRAACEQLDSCKSLGISHDVARAEIAQLLSGYFGWNDQKTARDSFNRWWKKWDAPNGLRGKLILNKRDERKEFDGRRNNGARVKFALTPAETRALRFLALKKGSIPVAIEWFVKDAGCSHETRELILSELDRASRLRIQPNWPDSIRRAARPTVEEEAAFRGRKALMEVELVDRRSLEWIDEDGRKRQMQPNTVWESDDMSINEPFTWLECGRDGERIHRVGRQTLCTLDVFSANWLGVSPIGRERDAYRAEDIADHMRDCVSAHGLPLVWRLERGPWENTFIDGVLIGRDSEGREIRWGGLDPLIHIDRAWKSRQKGTIESRFNFLQTLLAHESTSIGRVRGEFERQTKLYLAASKGDAKAWEQFWSMNECAEATAVAMREANHRPMKRRAHGKGMVIAADLYRPAERRDCPSDQWWRFLPEKRLATVRQGHIECSVRHYPLNFRFRVNGTERDLYLEHGFPVLIAFHPGHPENGCCVFNAAEGVRNRNGWAFGELLTIAPLAENAPQVNLSMKERPLHARRQANATMRSEFRAIMGTGVPNVSKGTARDGWGNSFQRDSSGASPERTSVPPRVTEGDRLITAAQLRTDDEIETELERVASMERDALRGGLISL